MEKEQRIRVKQYISKCTPFTICTSCCPGSCISSAYEMRRDGITAKSQNELWLLVGKTQDTTSSGTNS